MLLIFRNTVADGEVVHLDSSKKDAKSNCDDKDTTIEVLFIYFRSLISGYCNYNILTFVMKLVQVIRLGMQKASAGLLYSRLVSLVLLLVDGIFC